MLRTKQAVWGGAFCLPSRGSLSVAGHREPRSQPGTPGRGPLAYPLLCPDWPGNPGLVGEQLQRDFGPHLCCSSRARPPAVAAGTSPLPAHALPPSLGPRWGDSERPKQAFLHTLLRCGCHLGRAPLVQAASLSGQVLAMGLTRPCTPGCSTAVGSPTPQKAHGPLSSRVLWGMSQNGDCVPCHQEPQQTLPSR